MKRPQFFAAALWLLFLADGVRQGLAIAENPFFGGLGFDGFGLAAIALPAVFFTAGSLLLKSHPFDATLVRKWVNAKYGPETYESYTRAIRPLALFSAVGFVIGATALLSTMFGHSSGRGSLVLSGFFFSAGIGFMACRAILRRRGNTIE